MTKYNKGRRSYSALRVVIVIVGSAQRKVEVL